MSGEVLYVPPSWRGRNGVPHMPNCLSVAHDALEATIEACFKIQGGLSKSKERNLSHQEMAEIVLEIERAESEVR